jgi:hypothetical protein
MKTLNIEGFTVVTDIDEARPYTRIYEPDDDQSFIGEITYPVMEVIEQVIIGGQPIAQFYHANKLGYKDSRLEPFNWRETKKAVKIIYTGAMGGDPYEIEVIK